MAQGQLFDAPVTVASPLCIWTRCERKGRAVYGPAVNHDGCVNRSITCLTCGSTGEESRNTEPREAARAARQGQAETA